MKILEQSTKDRLIFEWLKSESWKLNDAQHNRAIAHNPDLSDPEQNNRRLALLYSSLGRSAILDEIPKDSTVSIVDIEKDDLAELYIIPVFDWYLDSGRSFRLVDTPANLKEGRGYDLSGRQGKIFHFDQVRRKIQYIQGYDANTTGEYLVLIADQFSGPYTIIDGTHRASALYQEHLKSINTPWRAFLLESPRFVESNLYIGSWLAKQALDQFKQLEELHKLW